MLKALIFLFSNSKLTQWISCLRDFLNLFYSRLVFLIPDFIWIFGTFSSSTSIISELAPFLFFRLFYLSRVIFSVIAANSSIASFVARSDFIVTTGSSSMSCSVLFKAAALFSSSSASCSAVMTTVAYLLFLVFAERCLRETPMAAWAPPAILLHLKSRIYGFLT